MKGRERRRKHEGAERLRDQKGRGKLFLVFFCFFFLKRQSRHQCTMSHQHSLFFLLTALSIFFHPIIYQPSPKSAHYHKPVNEGGLDS